MCFDCMDILRSGGTILKTLSSGFSCRQPGGPETLPEWLEQVVVEGDCPLQRALILALVCSDLLHLPGPCRYEFLNQIQPEFHLTEERMDYEVT